MLCCVTCDTFRVTTLINIIMQQFDIKVGAWPRVIPTNSTLMLYIRALTPNKGSIGLSDSSF